MEGDDTDLELPYYCTIKVHRLMCLELKKLTDRILRIFPAIELCRPRSSGLQAVCSLHVAVDKAKLLIQHCSESSKLYLAITGDKVLLRCEKIRNYMELCLTQIHDAVPSLLAAKIDGLIGDMRKAEFRLESSENEAGLVISALLRDSNSVKTLDIDALKLAALRLNITSPLAVLIEKRSIKRLLQKDHDPDPTKKKIFKCLFYILRKFSNSMLQNPDMDADSSGGWPQPPEEFLCSISGRLLFEPVVIATGSTYERVWIEKWFSQGHQICPVTRVKLDHLSLVPNTSIQALILKWCADHGVTIPQSRSSSSTISVSTFGTSMDVTSSCTSWGSEASHNKIGNGFTSLIVTSEFASMPWRSQCKAVQELLVAASPVKLCPVKALIGFMKDAEESGDAEALRDGAEVVLAMLARDGGDESELDDEDVHVLASFLESEIIDKALLMVESMSGQEVYKTRIVGSGVIPSIMKILDTPVRKYQIVAFKTLSNLSSDPDIGHHMVYLDGITKIVSFLGDRVLAGHCIRMIRNLCATEEARVVIAEASLSVSSMAGFLEGTSQEEQGNALDVMLCLCRDNARYRELVMNENVVLSLVDLSVNGKPKAKETAMELLRVLGRPMECGGLEIVGCLSSDGSWNDEKNPEQRKLPNKVFRFIGKGRRRSVFRFLSKGRKKFAFSKPGL